MSFLLLVTDITFVKIQIYLYSIHSEIIHDYSPLPIKTAPYTQGDFFIISCGKGATMLSGLHSESKL